MKWATSLVAVILVVLFGNLERGSAMEPGYNGPVEFFLVSARVYPVRVFKAKGSLDIQVEFLHLSNKDKALCLGKTLAQCSKKLWPAPKDNAEGRSFYSKQAKYTEPFIVTAPYSEMPNLPSDPSGARNRKAQETAVLHSFKARMFTPRDFGWNNIQITKDANDLGKEKSAPGFIEGLLKKLNIPSDLKKTEAYERVFEIDEKQALDCNLLALYWISFRGVMTYLVLGKSEK